MEEQLELGCMDPENIDGSHDVKVTAFVRLVAYNNGMISLRTDANDKQSISELLIDAMNDSEAFRMAMVQAVTTYALAELSTLQETQI